MNISFDAVYYEPSVLSYPLGQQLKEKYADLPWQEIESHNHIQQFRNAQNSEFPKLKRNLIIGTRKHISIRKIIRFLIFWFPIRLPDAVRCVFIVIWSVITTSVPICEYLSIVNK